MDLITALTEQRNIKVDRALLTADQLKQYDRWQEFFHGPVWRDLIKRYEPRIEALQNSYHSVVGEQQLGNVQGALKAYYDVFEYLPDAIHLEFLLQTGQITQDAGLGYEDPESPDDWSA